jgi:nucleoside 2-deoxyribosyltransferase
MAFDATRPIGACTVCTSPANILEFEFSVGVVVDCSRCGGFRVSRLVADNIGLPFQDKKHQALASHTIRKMQAPGAPRPKLTMDFFRALETRTLPSPADAIDNLLLWIAESASGSFGKEVQVAYSDPNALGSIGVIDPKDVEWVADSANAQRLIDGPRAQASRQCRLTPDGWLRVEELKRAHVSSKFAFFARQFNDSDLDKLYESCLRAAVLETGYELRTVTQRAGLIDAVIEDEIRRCRFVVADLSNKNDGAYWEAGFAEGLGKPVIYICRAKDEHGVEITTHFDANHRHTVKWDLAAPEDFATRLKAVIRNTLLGDANQSD